MHYQPEVGEIVELLMSTNPYANNEDWIHPSNNDKNLQLSFAKTAISYLSKGYSVDFQKSAPIQINNLSESTLAHGQKLLFQTGGTTGTPKRVVHLQSSISSPVAALSSRVGESSFSFVNCLPLNHVGGWMQVERALRTNGEVFFCSYKDLTGEVTKSILRDKWVSLVPTQLHFLVSDNFGCESLRACRGVFLGGAAMSEELIQKCRNLELPIYPTYGMTETAGMVTLLDASDFLNGNAGVGTALSHAELSLKGPEARIAIRAQSLCQSREGEVIRPNSWYLTDDFGKQDCKGNWFVLGRLDRMINTGGEMVCPSVIEKTILANTSARECRVVSQRDKKWGEIVTAWIAPLNITENAMKEALRGKLQDYEIPKIWHFVKQLPPLEKGKINRSF